MPDRTKYNLDFRPKNYWGPQEVETLVGARVKGELRRQQAIIDLEEKHADHEIIPESLTPEHRTAVGAVHPWLMGGEYLPDLKPNEVEIARVVMESTTMDVISVRARKTKNRILYRIVDEYEEDEFVEYNLTKKSSKRPLTFRELIQLFDNATDNGLVGNGRTLFYEEGSPAEEIYNFETASSAYYSELYDWYDETNEEWLLEKQKQKSNEELDEEYEERYLNEEPSRDSEEEKWRTTHSERLKSAIERVWESRYFKEEPSSSTDEQEWRIANQNHLDVQKNISDHVSKCEWQKPRAPGGYGGLAAQKGYQSIRSYVAQHLDAKGILPIGTHQIDGIEVKFHP